MQTLWNKGVAATDIVEKFTVGNDRELDTVLAKYDVLGSKAHVAMLCKIGLLTESEKKQLLAGLDDILSEIESGTFRLTQEAEDIHSQVELTLTERLGELGKKIHSGRSRNDQVLVDIKLFLRDEVFSVKEEVLSLFAKFQQLSEEYKEYLLPGYTHFQVAMPSSFGLWFGAYAETLVDDMHTLAGAFKVINQNPLGSAAGYGNSFPLDRKMTTELLGFETLNYNSIAAQLSRGKSEKAFAGAIASLASTHNKFASDCCLYMCTNFRFISFPDELTTGSSIMPHKKNPDVWEIMRGKTNRLQSVQNEIALLCTNEPHGYHRDLQLLKDILFPAIETLHQCLQMTLYMLEHIIVNKDILKENSLYAPMFSVEVVNNKVVSGEAFRTAYKEVGLAVKEGKFHYDIPSEVSGLHHTHEGSIGNLCNKEISEKMKKAALPICHTK